MEKKKLYLLIGGVALLGGLYFWSKKKKNQSPVLTEEEINAMNERVAANDAARKKLLDDLYVAYATNWKGSSDDLNYNYEIGNKQYKCAMADFQKMSNEELEKTLGYWTKGASIWEGNPLQYKMYADLSERYPLAFDDHPCSQNQKPVVI